MSARGPGGWRKSAFKQKWEVEPLPRATPLSCCSGKSAEPREVSKCQGDFSGRVSGDQLIHCPPLILQEDRDTPQARIPSPRSPSTGKFTALSPNGPQGEDGRSLGRAGGAGTPTMAADQQPPNIIHGASSSDDDRCVPRPSSGRTHGTFTDTISLEFLQRAGEGTEKSILTFISDPRDQGLE